MQTRTAKPRILAAIPARYHSTRFPGKPLALLAGKPLIEHVYRRAAAAAGVERVVVATDDARIVAAVEAFGGEARLTRGDHRSGTDRLAELVEGIECDLVVNVQGDEPLLDPRAIAQALEPFFLDASLEVSTLKVRLRDPESLRSPHVVKVLTDAQGFAVSFSRCPIPPVGAGEGVDLEARAYFKHVGLYVYTRDFLLRFPQLPPTPGEERERLEQLRILEHGIPIKVVETHYDSIGVDTPDDLARAEAALRAARS
ncbi:MAG: 3-deoxy-manno-octulosonate cytidylyltransferase [Acidobacteria bacterium]|nr:3-deoxy-manno-octulosonate cytidylyltransferase [Acidobacteriota bacterium]